MTARPFSSLVGVFGRSEGNLWYNGWKAIWNTLFLLIAVRARSNWRRARNN